MGLWWALVGMAAVGLWRWGLVAVGGGHVWAMAAVARLASIWLYSTEATIRRPSVWSSCVTHPMASLALRGDAMMLTARLCSTLTPTDARKVEK